MKTIEKRVYELVLPYADENGLELYDVIYEKQGKDMYLSIYIDKQDGVSIEDCEKLNNFIDPILDKELDIKEKYFLEVSSSGLEKNIRSDEQLKMFLNAKIQVKLFKPIDKSKDFMGILKKYNSDEIVIECEKSQYTFKRSDIASMKSVYDWDI